MKIRYEIKSTSMKLALAPTAICRLSHKNSHYMYLGTHAIYNHQTSVKLNTKWNILIRIKTKRQQPAYVCTSLTHHFRSSRNANNNSSRQRSCANAHREDPSYRGGNQRLEIKREKM